MNSSGPEIWVVIVLVLVIVVVGNLAIVIHFAGSKKPNRDLRRTDYDPLDPVQMFLPPAPRSHRAGELKRTRDVPRREE